MQKQQKKQKNNSNISSDFISLEYHLSVNSLGLDQVRRSVGPDLVPNCLQKLSANDTRRQRVKAEQYCIAY